ncbi:MAG TPA: tyrosine-protein phosphatase [Bryobacteraceae bacterium]|nr:tyrosine-protein phosphatase [Bryobacteraceae bacterium]
MQLRQCFRVLVLVLAALPVWARALEAPGIPNFHQINEHVYRGGQPSDEGWRSLAALGITTVIDLRRDNEDGEHWIAAERRAVEAAGMRYVSIPMKGIVAPSDEQIAKILALFESGERVFVHCRRGKDRTGMAIACYRIAHDRWVNQKALDEAKSLGLHWVEVGMKRYIMNFRAPAEAVVANTQAAAAGQ